MKSLKNIVLIIIAGILYSITGYGQKVEDREVSSFDKIFVLGKVNVQLVAGDHEVVRIEYNVIESGGIVTEVVEKALKIRIRPDRCNDYDVNVIVTYKVLRKISAHLGASIEATSTISGDYLELKAFTVGTIKVNVDLNAITMKTAEAGKIIISGKADIQQSNTNIAGRLLAYDLECMEVIADVNTGGEAEIWVKKDLETSVNTGGRLNHKGTPDTKRINRGWGGIISCNN